MENSKQFMSLLEELIKEMMESKNPLLESPVKTKGEVLVENRVRTILRANKEK